MKKTLFLFLCISSTLWISCNNDPQPDFTIEYEKEFCPPPCQVSFINTSENSDFYEWDFGDGNTSNGFSPNNRYNEQGSYTVALTATNENGNTLTTTKTVVIPEIPSKLQITKVTLRNFPSKDFFNNPWDEAGAGEDPDIFPEFTNSSSVTYFTLEDQVMNNLKSSDLPVEWELNIPYETPVNRTNYIDIMDKDIHPDVNDITGYVIFRPKNYTTGNDRYPSSVTINRNDLTVVSLDLKWIE